MPARGGHGPRQLSWNWANSHGVQIVVGRAGRFEYQCLSCLRQDLPCRSSRLRDIKRHVEVHERARVRGAAEFQQPAPPQLLAGVGAPDARSPSPEADVVSMEHAESPASGGAQSAAADSPLRAESAGNLSDGQLSDSVLDQASPVHDDDDAAPALQLALEDPSEESGSDYGSAGGLSAASLYSIDLDGIEFEEGAELEGADMSDGGAPMEDAEPEQGGGGAPRHAASRKTIEYYQGIMHEPIHEGAELTVLGASYVFLHMKETEHLRDGVFDRLCRLLHEVGFQQPNNFPPSFYLMKGIVGCEPADKYEGHLCTCCNRVFPKLASGEWLSHADDTCSHCGTARFIKRLNGTVVPAWRFWDLGVENVLRAWFADSEFAENVGRDRDFTDPATFWGSPWGKELDDACCNVFSKAEVREGAGMPAAPTFVRRTESGTKQLAHAAAYHAGAFFARFPHA